jgi:hypothetical protein
MDNGIEMSISGILIYRFDGKDEKIEREYNIQDGGG